MQNQTYRFIDVLPKLVDSYNNTPHGSLGGATPAPVTKTKEDEIRYIQYLVRERKNIKIKKTFKTKNENKKKKRKTFFKFRIGDLVRILHLKKTFEKGYSENFTLEYFKIEKKMKRGFHDLYKLNDMLGDPIQGTFYRYELQKITPSDDQMYKVKKIIKRRKLTEKQPEVLVKWLGWPTKFNSWVPKNDVKDV